MVIKCKEIIITPKSPLSCIVTGGTTLIKPHKVNDEILSLELPDGRFISKGDVLKVKERPYKINIITREVYDLKTISYILKTAERNKSSMFVLPMLGGSRHLFMYNSQLLNAFIGFNDHVDCIVLLYRWSGDPLFAKFENALKQFQSFIISYDPDPYHVIFVFKIPTDHEEDYKKFLIGKYSELSDIFKLKIIDFHNAELDGTLGQILFKSNNRRLELEEKLGCKLPEDSELLSIINEEDEILNLNNYIKKEQQ